MPIADAHHHLWDLGELRYPWLAGPAPADGVAGGGVAGDTSQLRRNYLLDDYLADIGTHDVVTSVHVQAECDPADAVAETRWLQQLAASRGFPHGIVAYVPLHRLEAARTIEAHCEHPNVRGVRQILNWHEVPAKRQTDRPSYLTDADWRNGFALLAPRGLSFDLQIYPWQMADAGRLAGAFPQTQLIVNHAGMPLEQDADGLAAWRTGMRALALHPNVSVKISGLGMFTRDPAPLIGHVIDIFGPDRCMFASNFPVDGLYGSYADLVATFTESIKVYSQAEQNAMLHDNAVRIYRLGAEKG